MGEHRQLCVTLALGASLWGTPARAAEVCEALPPAAAMSCDLAQGAEGAGQSERALRAWEAVLRLEPDFIAARAGRARALGAVGRDAEAEAAWASLGFDEEALEALGRLQLKRDAAGEAVATFGRLEQVSLGRPARALLLQAVALAATSPEDALKRLQSALAFQGADADPILLREATSAVASSAEDADDPGGLRAVLQVVRGAVVGDTTWLDELAQAAEVRRLSRELMAQAGRSPTADQRLALASARALYASGDLRQARERLTQLSQQAPRVAEVWVALSDVLVMEGELREAEQAARRAVSLAPLQAEPARALGTLLAERAGARFDDEAQYWLNRSLQANPGQRPARLLRSQVLLRLGRVDDARVELRKLADGTHDAAAVDARRALADIAWEPAATTFTAEPVAPPNGLSDQAWEAYWMAMALDSQGQGVRAQEVLASVGYELSTYVPALNLKARLQLAAGDAPAAVATFKRSSELEPDQAAVKTVLGLYATGEERVRLWREAAELGDPGAHFLLARRAAGAWHITEAERHLDAYFRAATSGAEYDDAVALRVSVAGQRQTLIALAMALVALLVGAPLLWWWRRRSGASLDELLAAHPDLYRDVARTVSAMRHEVLKHNTTFLAVVADDLELGRTETGAWAADRLFGEGGALTRFDGYLDTLAGLARVHGVRLNLRWKDERFRPILVGMGEVRQSRHGLACGDARVAPALRSAADALTGEGYRELGRWLTSLCVLPLDAELVRAIWARVAAEPAFRTQMEPEFDVRVEPHAAVRLFRDELRDILANLLRNALQATLDAGELRVGVHITIEEDPITCVQRVVIAVLDDAPKQVTTALLRGRYLEHGLGITVDLISRNGGSIRVEDRKHWKKAITVRLPLAEREVE